MTDRMVPGGLLGDDQLHASSVVANCAMNRERQLTGVNSYTRELGFNPLDVLTATVADRGTASWLDLCCGAGRAMIQAAEHLRRAGLLELVSLVGVDLVDDFHYDSRRHRITCVGPRELRLPYTYLGADEHAGPNYTGQPAVNSHYREHP